MSPIIRRTDPTIKYSWKREKKMMIAHRAVFCCWSPAFLLDTDASSSKMQNLFHFPDLHRMRLRYIADVVIVVVVERSLLPCRSPRSRRQIGPSVPENVSVHAPAASVFFPELVLLQQRIAFAVFHSFSILLLPSCYGVTRKGQYEQRKQAKLKSINLALLEIFCTLLQFSSSNRCSARAASFGHAMATHFRDWPRSEWPLHSCRLAAVSLPLSPLRHRNR